jgi:hypothetical protein
VIATKIALPQTRATKQGCGSLSIDARELLNPGRRGGHKRFGVRTTSNKAANVLTRPRTPESVEKLQLETPGDVSARSQGRDRARGALALGRNVGDDDLNRVVVDLVGNAAPAVQEVPQVRAEGWIGESNAHGEVSHLPSCRVRAPRAHSRLLPCTTLCLM